jgi:hypothetical protein
MPTIKIDSNVTGLRFAEEETLKTLPAAPVWYPLEPNSYSDFGGQITTVARNPINPSRQQKKGVTTDLSASGGFNQDLTHTNLTRFMQGFMFADIREKNTTTPMNAAAIAITSVAAATKAYATTAVGFAAGDLVLASGFGVATNNGVKTVATNTGGEVTVAEALTDEAAPPLAAALRVVGFQFPADDASIVFAAGSYPRLVSAATDPSTLGLIPGEWLYLGGDGAVNAFVSNAGFARINAVTSTYIEFDKTDWTPVAEGGAGKSIRVFFGDVLKNESDPDLIKRRTYQMERTLGKDDDGTMSEYLTGSVANQFTLNAPQAQKIAVDMTFMACDNEQRSGADGVKDGTRPTLVESDAYNTTNDFARIKLSSVSGADAAVTPMFMYATDLTLSVNNNVSENKALGVLGAFDTSAGMFEVKGSLTAYFADVAGVQAVRNNADVTLDICMAKQNAGIVFDVPLLSLGNGRLAVEKDKPITLPLDIQGAEGKFGHTLLFQVFNYLPTRAAA